MAEAVTSAAVPTPKQAGSFIDPQALMAIRNLELRARIVVQGFWNGLHRSPYHGFSVEFTEYRQYTPGDDPRYLDWRLYARSDRYYIKKFEDETNLRCYLLVDNSRSMSYGSLTYSKAQYANTLAATFAHFLYGQGQESSAACSESPYPILATTQYWSSQQRIESYDKELYNASSLSFIVHDTVSYFESLHSLTYPFIYVKWKILQLVIISTTTGGWTSSTYSRARCF